MSRSPTWPIDSSPPVSALVMGLIAAAGTRTPARIVGEVSGGAKRWVEGNPETYRELARRHAAGVRPVSTRR